MERRTARAYAMKLIYEWEMGGAGGEETRLNLLGVQPDEQEADYMNQLFNGVVENVESIDAHIQQFARGWSLDRITRVDLAILRLAIYEMAYVGLASSVAINEAVELANTYSTDKAGSFVNGILGNYSRSLEQ